MSKTYRAIALFSGGLDSLLSVKWMEKVGVEVIPVFFKTPFFTEERAILTAQANALKLEVVDFSEAHLEMLKHPRYGFGKNFNPCIDCHGLMFQHAGELMSDYNADFLISGEVLSQRPMSQRRDAMNAVARLSGYKDLLIRPLSQKLLPDTKPIRDGWIKIEDMLDINGRSRKRQMELASELGIIEFPSPAGGCRLTDQNFSLRLKELVDHNQLNLTDISLLKFGRHFRLPDGAKLIVGRDENDNEQILANKAEYFILENDAIPGPLGLLCHPTSSAETLSLAASILAFYYTKAAEEMIVYYGTDMPLTKSISVYKVKEDLVRKYIITR